MMRSLVIFSSLFAVAATAQESDAPPADDQIIEQIIVTATRREESVTDVPLAVSAYDAQRIELSRVTDIMELMRVAPSFMSPRGRRNPSALRREFEAWVPTATTRDWNRPSACTWTGCTAIGPR